MTLLPVEIATRILQGAAGEPLSPLPTLSIATLISLCTGAVGYGALRSDVRASKAERRELQEKLNEIDRKVDDLAIAVARLEEAGRWRRREGP